MWKLAIFCLIAVCLSGCLPEERDNMADTILSSYCWVPNDTTFWDIQQCPQGDKGKDDIGLIAAVICGLMLLWGVVAFISSTIINITNWFRRGSNTDRLR